MRKYPIFDRSANHAIRTNVTTSDAANNDVGDGGNDFVVETKNTKYAVSWMSFYGFFLFQSLKSLASFYIAFVNRHRRRQTSQETCLQTVARDAACDGKVDWWNDKIIQPSESAWSSPCLLITKSGTNEYRFVNDLRAVNKITKPIFWPLPTMEDILTQCQTKTCLYSRMLTWNMHIFRSIFRWWK